MSEKKVSRRKYIVAAGAAAAAAAIGGAAYYLYRPTPPEKEPLEFDIWAAYTEIVEGNVAGFEEQYDEEVDLRIIPGDYNVVMESKHMAGTPADIMYTMADRNYRWYKAGWVMNFEDQPWISELKQKCFGGVLEACLTAEGEMVALPYANQTYCLWRNAKLLEDAGFGDYYPSTKDELYDNLLAIKNMGLSDYPYVIPWGGLDWQLPAVLIQECFAEGDYLFDENLDPTFDVDTGIMDVLEHWKRLWAAELVPGDVWVWPDFPLMTAFMSGAHAYSLYVDTHRIFYRDPSMSAIADYAEWCPKIPGKTGGVPLNAAALYTVSKKDRTSEELERVMNLAKFLSFTDKYGAYYVAKRFSVLASFFPAYAELAADPDVKAAFLGTEEQYNWQKSWYETMKSPTVYRAYWYPEWTSYVKTQVHDGVTGTQPLQTTIENIRDKAVELKSVYP